MLLVSGLEAASSAELSIRLVVEPTVVNRAVFWLFENNAEVVARMVAVSLDTTSDDRIDEVIIVDDRSGLMDDPKVVIDLDENVLVGLESPSGKVEPTVEGCVPGVLITVLAVAVEEVSIDEMVVEKKVSTDEAVELDEAAREIELLAESEVADPVSLLVPVLDILTRSIKDTNDGEDISKVDELTAAGA